jgi:ABC-2 type transport system permease protein
MSDLAVCALFVRIRWKMLRGVLATSGSQKVAVVIGLVASVIAGVVGGVAAFVIGRTSDDLDAAYVTLITGIVLIVVMVGVIAGVTQPVDPRVLATEPLGQRQLGLGLLAASASGPPGLSAALVAIGLFGGAVRGWLSIIPVTFAVVAFLATLLLLSRTTINSLGLLSTRHPRVGQIVVGLSSLAFYAAFQIVPRAVADLDDGERTRLANGLAFTPMGQIGRGLADAGTEPALALVHVMIGVVWLVPLLWLFSWTTRRLVTSVKGDARGRAVVRPRRHPVRSLARRMCGNGAVGAVAWRGVLTRFRTPRTALETFTGAGVGLAIVLVPVLTGRQAGAGAVLVGGAVQLAVLFMAGNSFGSDGPAMSGELLTGVDPAVLVQAKARSVVVSAAPVAVVGPVIAAAFTGEWNYLPAGFIVGIGGLFAGAGAAMVQSSFVPIAIPESDNPLASGDSGKGWFAGLVLAVVLFALALLTLPVALALLWAVDRQSLSLVTVFAVVALGVGVLVERGGIAIAAGRWRDRGPELYAQIVPAR